jgi:hypothetical protein
MCSRDRSAPTVLRIAVNKSDENQTLVSIDSETGIP